MTATVQNTGLALAGLALAAKHLEHRGFSILACGCETRCGTLDLVAADAQRTVFADVYSRRVGSNGIVPIGERAAQRLRRKAVAWLADHEDQPQTSELRFDAILVVFDAAGRVVRLDHEEASR